MNGMPTVTTSGWSAEGALISFLASVIANAVTSIVSAVTTNSEDALARKSDLLERLRKDGTLNSLLQKGVAVGARAFTGDESRIDRIRSFLVSPEAETIARQMFSTHLLRIHDNRALARLKSEFGSYLNSFVTGLERESTLVDSLFDALFLGCERVLQLAIENGVLGAH